jgi:hypothetical protein
MHRRACRAGRFGWRAQFFRGVHDNQFAYVTLFFAIFFFWYTPVYGLAALPVAI